MTSQPHHRFTLEQYVALTRQVRDDTGAWATSRHTDPGDVIALRHVGAELRLGEIYAGAFDLPG